MSALGALSQLLEIAVALKAMADSDDFDALIAIGCVIRGETYHFELVANESGAGVTRVALDHQIPIANAQGRADQARSRVALNQAELRHRQLLSSVTLEVRDTSADVEASQQAIETSRVARELAEENLRNQEKRHEVGMATTKDLLDFQTQLTEARFREVQARVRHAVAIARWRRAQGRLLAEYQIVIEHPKRGTPWFARF